MSLGNELFMGDGWEKVGFWVLKVVGARVELLVIIGMEVS